ncbi:MAG: K(+)-transporting ATPase subunit F [Bacteroidota bacterium]
MSSTAAHIIGAVLTLFILGYLVYSLIKPEKF